MLVPFVAKPDRFGSDAIIPGKVSDEVGFVTEGNVLEGVHGPIPLYFSRTGIRQLAFRYHQLGLVDEQDARAALEEAEVLREQLLDEKAHSAELEEQLDRIAGLRKAGFTVQKKPGAPKTKETV